MSLMYQYNKFVMHLYIDLIDWEMIRTFNVLLSLLLNCMTDSILRDPDNFMLLWS